MLKLTLSGGRPIYMNPRYILTVTESPVPANPINNGLAPMQSYVTMLGEPDQWQVAESPAQIARQVERALLKVEDVEATTAET